MELNISSFLCLLLLSTIFLILLFQSPNSPYNPFIFPTQHDSQLVNTTVEDETVCDLFEGKWVREANYKGPLYTKSTCPMLPDSKDCGKYGKDMEYLYWKWKPNSSRGGSCELSRFDAEEFLGIVRGRRMAFVGDSLARNQMESLLCLLFQVESPREIYKDNSDKVCTWYFPSHDFTLMVMWTQFLVEATERIVDGVVISNSFNLQVDTVNPTWAAILPDIHYLVISSGNWFFRPNYLYENGTLLGCTGCQDKNISYISIESAIRKIFRTSLQFITQCNECHEKSLVTILRTFSPPHFEHGSWFTGGYCNRTQPLDVSEVVKLDESRWKIRGIQLEELSRIKEVERSDEEVRGKWKFEVLDVTKAMLIRADGHPGSHVNKKWMKRSNDCLHWCLPGPVDMWNQLLLQIIKRNS